MQQTTREPRLVEHLERYLGRLAAGWERTVDGTSLPFTVGRFDDPPFADCVGFSTIGLSDHILKSSGSAKTIRQELFALFRDPTRSLPFTEVLQVLASGLIKSGSALLRGQVIGPRGPFWKDSALEAFYVSSPSYLPDEFAVCDLGDGHRCVFAWLIPITRAEAEYVASSGWRSFEALLERENPDLLAADRGSCV